MSTVVDPLVGRLLDGRYQISQRLARGGMATVYQAVDTRLTRTVAVKVMHVGLGDDVEFARKFDREARAAAKLSHPNVVSVFDQGADIMEGHVSRPYIVMEYVDGQTLRDVINRDSPLPPERALEVMEPVLAALACAHDAGLVHRDVKPENVLISDSGRVKVADFGLAKAISSQTQTATQGLLIGTVSYLPPELVISGKADARSDVYSAGVVLFELLTGLKPHTGETPIQVAYAHVHADVPLPSTFPSAGYIPPYLDALVARATARDPQSRPHDAKVLLAQVRRVRSALREGLADDPELTEDLALPPVRGTEAGAPPAPEIDRADFETTQLVSPSGPPATYAARPSFARPTTPASGYSPPTVLDAPPPAPRPLHTLPPERVAAQQTRRARKRRRGWMALLIVLLLTTMAALTGWYLTTGRFTTAPALTSLTRTDAQQVAEKAGLGITFDDTYSETVPKGSVVSTEPGAGSKVRKGGQIEAAVSRGPERYPMPRVVGLSQTAAEAAIQQAHLTVRTVKQRYSEDVAAGLVTATSAKFGASMKPGAAVDLTVSKGPAPIKIVNYSGKPFDQARDALVKAGFQVTEGVAANSDTVAKDRVLTQDPKKGRADKGTTITLTRSLGPVLVTVPNVSRMGIRAAEKTLKEAGFKTKRRAVAVNYLGVGFVVYTNPRAATAAPKGSTITIYTI